MTTIYAFSARTREQADALEARGAVYYPTMQQWIVKDLSSRNLRKLKNKGIVPQATPGVTETTEPPPGWPAWINWTTYLPPSLITFVFFWAEISGEKEMGVAIILGPVISFLLASVLIKMPLALGYAFYRKIKGDHRFMEKWKEASRKNRYSDDFATNPAYSSFVGNIYYYGSR